MDFFLFLLLVLAGGCLFAFQQAPLAVATTGISLIIFVGGLFLGISTSAVLLFLFLFLLLFLPLNVESIRRKYISDRVYTRFKELMPQVSATEQQALEAGTVWWDAQLFSGRPDWQSILSFQVQKISDEEQEFLDGPVDTLCAMLDDWRITHEEQDLPPDVWTYLKEKGFFGLIIPKEYGGLGFSALAHSAVVAKIASRSVTAAVTVMVPNSLGPAELLLRYGTDEQKKHYLPRLADGREIPCFGLTSPEAGSDASAIPDTGVVTMGEHEGKEVLGIRLNWHKRYITLGPIATVMGLAFRLLDPDTLLGEEKDRGITFALIPANLVGIDIGRRHFPLNSAFVVGPNSGADVFIPVDWIIGGRERAGQGWRMLMETLAAGRGISLPALSTGGSKLISRFIGAYARVRRQFGLAIGRFEGVEEVLARIAARTYSLEAGRVLTASAVDAGHRPAVVSGIMKYLATETMRLNGNDAMDIQGGGGICLGPKNILGRLYQTLPIGITVEGANILTRSFITFNQALLRCHPFLLDEVAAVADPDQETGKFRFDRALFGHLGFLCSNFARALLLGLGATWFLPVPGKGKTRHALRNISRMSAAFAVTADLLMLALGGRLKRKEKLTGRMADGLGHLYLATATVKYYNEQGQRAEDDPLLSWNVSNSLFMIQEALDGVLQNFPIRFAGTLLYRCIFPLGKPFHPPTDRLGAQAAATILQPSEQRDRLTSGIYLPVAADDQLAILEDALVKTIAAELIEVKIKTAVKDGRLQPGPAESLLDRAVAAEIITADGANIIRVADEAGKQVTAVDDFAPEELKRNVAPREDA